MQSRTLKRSESKVSFLDLYIFNYNGDQETPFGFNSLPSSSLLRSRISAQVPTAASIFATNFINYPEGKILCVNTPYLMNKDVFKSVNSVSNNLKFTLIQMPAEFINVQPSQLTTPYRYGERIRVAAAFESIINSTSINGQTQTVIPRNKTLIYRDSNVRGRSKIGESKGGAGIGVWS